MIIHKTNQRRAGNETEGSHADRRAMQLLAEAVQRERRLRRDIAEVTAHRGWLGVAGSNLVWVLLAEDKAPAEEAESELVRLVRLTGGVCETIEIAPRARIRALPRAAMPAMLTLATGGLSDGVLASWSELQVCVLARALVVMLLAIGRDCLCFVELQNAAYTTVESAFSARPS